MRARGLWGVLGVAALVAVALFVLRGPLASRLMRAALERNFATDEVAALPDGLHVGLCGAGGPLPAANRSGPCVAVVAGTRLFVVDVGAGAPRNLGRLLDWQPGQVEAVLLTHFHSDHIDGLGELSMLRWVGGTHLRPLPVYGPPGVAEVVAGFDHAYRLDAGYRTAHHGPEVAPPAGAGLVAGPFALPRPGRETLVLSGDGLEIRAFRVDHAPAEPAVGYRFDYAGRSVVVSGDTARNAELERMAQGVDLLVHEALSPVLVEQMREAAVATGRTSMARIAHDIPDYHTTPVEAAALAQSAGARHLLFYHVVPPLPLPGLEAVFLAGVSDAYDGPVTLGVDGTRISLPAGP